jgi:conjugative relaxase-like TrwC/TraI family protein
MLAIKPQYSLKDARQYFKEHLTVADYYTEGQHVPGHWFGHGAESLGLSGVTSMDEFVRLCENLHPHTGKRMTMRQNTTRTDLGRDGLEHENSNRRIFYDFTFSPAKSVSIAALPGGDPRIVEAHAKAVSEALGQLQSLAATRVRKGSQCADRLTGNIVAAVFQHDTSRALDPHLHSHCILFNATFDPVEKQWKALQNYEMLAAQKFVESVYYHELARSLVEFGYQIESKPRGDFEIKGVSPELIKKFSKRHDEIDRKTGELLMLEPEKAEGNLAAIRENIAHKDRSRKIRDVGLEKLRALWDRQTTESEKESLRKLAYPRPTDLDATGDLAEKSVTWAEEHLFERRSVVQEHELWRHALEHARGREITVAEIKAATQRRNYLRNKAQPGKVTTREHLQREYEIVQMAKEGVGDCLPLVRQPHPIESQLDEEQRQALAALLSNTNFVSLFRGGAGTGKSYVLLELVEQIRKSGRPLVVLAPQRQQVIDLERGGLRLPATVSSFLLKRELNQGAAIIVDEAGQIGGQQMWDLIRLVRERNGRLILSGDTRQHGAVEASDALLAIERHSGVRPVELRSIRRQDPRRGETEDERERIKQYRKAVKLAADGKTAESFCQLVDMGAVVSCSVGDQVDKLADEYVRLAAKDVSTVVVSQTWAEVHRVNEQVRARLKNKGLIGANDVTIQTLERVDLTNAQKRDARFYAPDAVIVFNQKVRQAPAGATGKLSGIVKTGLLVEVNGRFVTVADKMLDKITICRPKETQVAANDRLHLKANRKLATGARVANGELVTVKSVHGDGSIELADGRVLDANYREFVAGYTVTSYSSQGKTVDYVLFSDSTVKAATSAEQWYVSISRGRRGIRIFTPDKEQLLENIRRSAHRPLALDLAAGSFSHGRTRLWNWLRTYLLRFGRRAADNICRLKQAHRHHHHQPTHKHEYKINRMLGQRSPSKGITH